MFQFLQFAYIAFALKKEKNCVLRSHHAHLLRKRSRAGAETQCGLTMRTRTQSLTQATPFNTRYRPAWELPLAGSQRTLVLRKGKALGQGRRAVQGMAETHTTKQTCVSG